MDGSKRKTWGLTYCKNKRYHNPLSYSGHKFAAIKANIDRIYAIFEHLYHQEHCKVSSTVLWSGQVKLLERAGFLFSLNIFCSFAGGPSNPLGTSSSSQSSSTSSSCPPLATSLGLL